MKVQVTGIGLYLPPQIETAEEIAQRIGKSIEWVKGRTGVRERRVSDIDVDEMGAIFNHGVWKLDNVIHVLRKDGYKIDKSKNSKNINQYRIAGRGTSIST